MGALTILPPKDNVFNPIAAISLIQTLVEQFTTPDFDTPLSLSILAYYRHVAFVVYCRKLNENEFNEVNSIVTSLYPGAIVLDDAGIHTTFPLELSWLQFYKAPSLPYDAVYVPVTALRPATDPLITFIQAMNNLELDEVASYDVTIYGRHTLQPPTMREKLFRFAEVIQTSQGNLSPLLRRMQEDKRREIKRKQTAYWMKISVAMMVKRPERFHLLNTLASVPRFFADELYPAFERTKSFDREFPDKASYIAYATAETDRLTDLPEEERNKFLYLVTPEELAMMWHLPHKEFNKVKIQWASSFPKQLETNGKFNENYCRVGWIDEVDKDIALNRADRRYHAYITGQTGMGKSTLLHHLINEDILAGCGVAVIDPHGELIKDILNGATPDRLKDVVLIECGDTEYPVPLNPFRLPEGVDELSVFNTVLQIFKSIYAKNWSATRMETVFRNILQVVLSDPDCTPLDVQQIISNANYRRKIVAQQKRDGKLAHAAKNWWSIFDEGSDSEQRGQTQSALSRLSSFLGSPHLERMACHPSTIDFRALIRDKKIVLVDLSGDAIASEVESLGAIFLSQFYLSNVSLGAISGKEPRFYLYVDETQRFITTSLSAIFSEARKFGLSLTLSNQFIGQLDEDAREGILKNVGTKFSFACHPSEASLTGKMYEPDVTQEELTNLGMGWAAAKTRFEGQNLPAFIVRVNPPPYPRQKPPDLAAIRQQTRDYLGMMPAADVTKWIDQRYDSDLFKKPPTDVDLSDFEKVSE